MHKLLFCDTETTGNTGEDRLCQVAFNTFESSNKKSEHYVSREAHEGLFKPPLPIKIAAMAVTHITNEMVADKPVFQGSYIHTRLNELLNNNDHHIFVAHNAEFDIRMLKYEGISVPTSICTLKLARHIDKGGKYENHQLQYLRYFYGLKVDASAHNAMGDVIVLEEVFFKLMEELAELEDISITQTITRAIEISKLPSEFRIFNFGKYNGRPIAEVKQYDRGYLEWLLNAKLAKPEGEENWIYTLTKALQ